MKRLDFGLGVLVMLIGVGQANGWNVRLDFDSPGDAGGITDRNGVETGFTHRLPGTGSSLPEYGPDANLELILQPPGLLQMTSTHADRSPTERHNPEGMETVGLRVPDVGNRDFTISAQFRDINLAAWSDQLMLYAGTSVDQNVHAGFHQGDHWNPQLNRAHVWEFDDGSNSLPIYAIAGTDHAEWEQYWIDNGFIGPANGDDAVFTLGRTDEKWWIGWEIDESAYSDGYTRSGNLKDTKWAVEFPDAQADDDLYVGILYANPRTDTTQTSYVDWVEVTVEPVPEPSAIIVWFLIGSTALAIGWWRRRKAA